LRLTIEIKMEYKEDKHYIARILKGESNAYAFLVNKYKSMAYSLALKLVKNREMQKRLHRMHLLKHTSHWLNTEALQVFDVALQDSL